MLVYLIPTFPTPASLTLNSVGRSLFYIHVLIFPVPECTMGYGDKVISSDALFVGSQLQYTESDTVICPVLTYRAHSLMAAVG